MEDLERRRFSIGACLGSGGFGEVYRATMRAPGGLQTDIALKVLRSDLRLEADAVRRLRDEGRLLARIQHPVVVRAHDLTRVDGRLGLVTEFVDGADLEAVLSWPEPPGPRALLQMTGAVAAGLTAAWETRGPDHAPLRIIHRDLKATNIRIGRHGEVKLLDFGIASFTASDRHAQTASDVVIGSLPYMAPERFLEGGAAVPASDIFGLGCCLYEGLAGQRFYEDGKLRALSALALDRLAYDLHLHERIGSLTGSPPSIVELVEQCLAYEPSVRPTSKMLTEECEALADELPGPSLRRWCRGQAWTDAPRHQGSLEGRTLVEGTLTEPDPDGPDRDHEGPRIIARPLGTLDPAMFDDGGTLPKNTPYPDTPTAPPAFPSLPLGMAIHQLQISEQEVSDVLGTVPPKPARRAPPTSAPELDPDGVSRLQWALLAGGCLVLGGAIAGVTLGLAVVALVVLTT